MRADSYHRSVLRCGCPVAERSHPTTRPLSTPRPNLNRMFRNGQRALFNCSFAAPFSRSLLASNARVRLGVFFSGVLLGPY